MAEMSTIYIKNKLKKSIVKFIKKDGKTNKLLEGAIFSLHKYNEEIASYEEIRNNLSTDVNGELVVDELVPAKYKLVETKAPDGYYFDETKENLFEISLDKDNEIIQLETITITNMPLVEIKVIKVDEDNESIYLKGAKFSLIKNVKEEGSNAGKEILKDEIIDSNIITNDDGSVIIKGLKPGKYKLVEIEAPLGYDLPEKPETEIEIE